IRGVPNFQTLNDRVSRGGQPSEEGFRNLAASGVRTIVDLREDDARSKREKKLVKSLGMRYVNIPLRGMHTPHHKQIEHALKVLNEEKAGPVFIHCQRGADRTGVVLACYRMEHDRWSNREALDEARSYGMSWYQFPLIRYIMGYRPHEPAGGLAGAAESVRGHAGDAVDSLKDLPKRGTGIFGR